MATLCSLRRFSSSLAKKYAGRFTVSLIPGDGVGREITDSVCAVFNAAAVPIDWEPFKVSGESRDYALLRATTDSIRRNKVALKGILITPPDLPSINVALRKELDLFASLALAKSLLPPCPVPDLNDPNPPPRRFAGVDIALVRENTEGEYSGLEHEPVPGVVEMIKLVSRKRSERIARFAFDYARANVRRKVTAVHKANIMKLTDGLFLSSCKSVADSYASTGIAFDSMIVDNASMQLVSNPSQFDVVVLGNLYGSILSNIAAALVGGPGMVAGANFGHDYAVFEPGCRHVGKDIAGQNSANPSAHILSAVLMLRHLQLDSYADRISEALLKTIINGDARTLDLGGNSSTTEFTAAIINNL